jgi:GEVED domain/Secretion system C-terminal sorting domain
MLVHYTQKANKLFLFLLFWGLLGCANALAQSLKLKLEVASRCDGNFVVNVLVKTATLAPNNVQLGTSSILLNYNPTDFDYVAYTPSGFDGTTNSPFPDANWEKQVWTVDPTAGIFNVVMLKKPIATGNTALDKVDFYKIGTLSLTKKTTTTNLTSLIRTNPAHTDFYAYTGENLRLEEFPSLAITMSSLFPTITGDLNVCGGSTTKLTATGGSTYKWSNGATTAAINVGVGTYSVTATSVTCMTTKSVTVINKPVQAIVTGNLNICNGTSTKLTASGGTTYKWSNGATTPSIVVPVGTYTVTTTLGNCTDTKTVIVTTSTVTPDIIGDLGTCNNTPTKLTATGGTSYSWGTGATTATINANAGVYIVTVTSGTCSAVKTVTVTNLNNLEAKITGNLAVCNDINTTLTASGGTTYKWSNAAITPTINVGAGTYTVTVTTGACTATKTVVVTSNVLEAKIAGNLAVCNTDKTTLTASGGTTYKWSNAAITPTINVGAGTYTVTVTTGACTATKNVVVTNSILEAKIAGILTVCNGTTTALTASGGTTYKWSNGSTSPIINVETGTYSVSVTTGTCTSTKTVEVKLVTTNCGKEVAYCYPKSVVPWYEWISNVSFNTIDNNSKKDDIILNNQWTPGIGDFTSTTTTVTAGASYSIGLTRSVSWSGYQPNMFWRVWMDFNRDGDFADAGEMVLQTSSTQNTVKAIINIPTAATTGKTRMRVAANTDRYTTPCDGDISGEVEDYTINIITATNTGNCINDLTPPVFSNCPIDITVNKQQDIAALIQNKKPNATDNCTLDPIITIATIVTGNKTTATYTATDAKGNKSTCAFNITISDVAVPSAAPDIAISMSSAKNYTIYSPTVLTITAKNIGTVAANNVKISIPFPQGMVFSAMKPRNEDYIVPWNNCDSTFCGIWTIPIIEPGVSQVFELTLFPLSNINMVLKAKLVACTPADGNPTNNVVNNSLLAIRSGNDNDTRGLIFNSLYPNPASEDITLQLFSKEKKMLKLNIYNNVGIVVGQEDFNVLEGINTKIMDISTYPDGIYHVLPALGDVQYAPMRFIKRARD